MSRFIDQRAVVEALAALAQDTRMTAFQLLAAAHPASIGAGDIARGCNVPQNTMSTHLAILTRAGLLQVERAGRQMNYRANLEGISAVLLYLTENCCNARSEIMPASNAAVEKKGRKPTTRTEKSKPTRKR